MTLWRLQKNTTYRLTTFNDIWWMWKSTAVFKYPGPLVYSLGVPKTATAIDVRLVEEGGQRIVRTKQGWKIGQHTYNKEKLCTLFLQSFCYELKEVRVEISIV